MDKELLVRKLRDAFVNAHALKGLYIDAFGLIPAYGGILNNSYTLGVSAPSLTGLSKMSKINKIFDIIYESLEQPERKMINVVKVFDNKEAFINSANRQFDDSEGETYLYPQRLEADIFEMNN